MPSDKVNAAVKPIKSSQITRSWRQSGEYCRRIELKLNETSAVVAVGTNQERGNVVASFPLTIEGAAVVEKDEVLRTVIYERLGWNGGLEARKGKVGNFGAGRCLAARGPPSVLVTEQSVPPLHFGC